MDHSLTPIINYGQFEFTTHLSRGETLFHPPSLTFTGELAVVLSGALVATDDALHVLLIALHVQARVAAAARTLGAVGLRVWCHAVVLLLQLLLRHHGRRGRDEGAQRGELLVRGDAGAHRRQVSRPGTVRGRRLGHERHASREVQVEGTEFTLATRVEETCGGWGRSLAKGAPEMRIVGDNSGGIGPRDGASSVGVGLQEGSFGGLRRGEYSTLGCGGDQSVDQPVVIGWTRRN